MSLVAVEDVFEAHCLQVFRLCHAILRDRADAEDAVQETFVRVARNADRLHGDLRPYVVTVARSVCFEELRRRRRHPWAHDEDTERAVDRAACPEETALTRHVLTEVWGKLSERERQLLGCSLSGFPARDLSTQTGLSSNAALQALSRARRRARRFAAELGSFLGAPAAWRLVGHRAAPRIGRAIGGRVEGVAALLQQSTTLVAVLPVAIAVLATQVAAPAHGSQAPPTASLSSARDGGAAAAAGAAATQLGTSARQSKAGAGFHAVQGPPASFAGQPTTPDANPLHSGLVGPSASTRPEDTTVSSFTTSPGYGGDRTIFASARVDQCAANCDTVLRSGDGGATWQALASTGFTGGTLLLPPAYPRDTTLLAQGGSSALARSDDGGASFSVAVAATAGRSTPLGIDPSSPAGDLRVLLAPGGKAPLLVYDGATRRIGSGPSLPAGVGEVDQIAPAAGTDELAVLTQATLGGSAVYLCHIGGACEQTPAPAQIASLIVSPTFASDHTILVPQSDHVAVIVAGQSGEADVAVPQGGARQALLPAADYATSRRLYLVTTDQSLAGTLFVSDGNNAFRQVRSGLNGVALSLAALAVLPDARMLVPHGRTQAQPWDGLECSTDTGATWRPRCQ